MDENRSSKRRRLDDEEKKAAALRLTDLPEVLLSKCLSFVGPGHYRFIAGTCRYLKDQYNFPKKTTWKNAAVSVQCAKLCRRDFVFCKQPFAGCSPVEMIVDQAIHVGRLNVIQWAVKEHSFRFRGAHFCKATSHGHLHVLKWCDSMKMPWLSSELFCIAATSGHVSIMEWFYQRYPGSVWSPETAECAAKGGHVPVLQWLKDKGLFFEGKVYNERAAYDKVCFRAADHGDVDALQWLLENGFATASTVSHVFVRAVELGKISAIRWARDNGASWDASTFAFAAGYGMLKVLQWLRENGCPWDSRTITCLVQRGHHSAAQWARDNGCPEP